MKIVSRSIPVIFLLLILTLSCTHKGDVIRKKDTIPVSKLVPLLTDIYITDGLLSYPPIKNRFKVKDTISSYVDVIEKHGYTKQQVDRTLKYYFLNNPKKLQKIYDEVLSNLSVIQSGIESSKGKVSGNLWNQKDSFSLPEEGASNPLYFTIPVSDTGLYELSLNAKLYSDDESIDPKITVFFWYADSAGNSIRQPWKKTMLIKDNEKHSYSIVARLFNPKYKNIGGFLHDCTAKEGGQKKHSEFSNIRLMKGAPQ